MTSPIILTLAQGSADSVPLAAVSAIITAIFGGIALVVSKARWEKQAQTAREKRSTTIEGQPVEIRMEDQWVTKADLDEHLERIDRAFEELKKALEGERGIARTANGNLHKRIDQLSEGLGGRLANLEGSTEKIAENVKMLLELALGAKPPTTRGR